MIDTTSFMSFPVPTKVSLGIYDTSQAYQAVFDEAAIVVSPEAREMLVPAPAGTSDQRREVNLVVISPAELGATQGIPYNRLIERATASGLNLCPMDVGPALRLIYRDQPARDWLCIGMEPFIHRTGAMSLFVLGSGGGKLWLQRVDGSPAHVWPSTQRFAFVGIQSD